MPSDSIVDSRLTVRLDLSNAPYINVAFAQDLANLAHLSSQLLLFDRVLIPTYDYGILPALISWLGIDLLTQMLEADAVAFIRRYGLLGYAGNGNGISTFIIQAAKKPLEWWADAMFAASPRSLELQLSNGTSSITDRQRSRLAEIVLSKSSDLQNDNDFFIKHVVRESYVDVLNSPVLSQSVLAKTQRRPNGSVDLQRLPQVQADQLRVLRGDGSIRDSVDVVLRVSEINMELIMAYHNRGADLHTTTGADFLLEQKLLRAGVRPQLLDGFIRLLDLNNLTDIRPAVINRELGASKLWQIRQSRKGIQFREWLRRADAHDARELERAYVEALGHSTLTDSLPLRVVRLGLTTAAGMVLPGIGGLIGGLAAGAADSFFVDKWLQGFSPKMFFDELQELVPGKQRSGRSRRQNWQRRS